ncbi:MAG: hypothetical protein AAF548_02765 [Actinomycetota bacterium]
MGVGERLGLLAQHVCTVGHFAQQCGLRRRGDERGASDRVDTGEHAGLEDLGEQGPGSIDLAVLGERERRGALARPGADRDVEQCVGELSAGAAEQMQVRELGHVTVERVGSLDRGPQFVRLAEAILRHVRSLGRKGEQGRPRRGPPLEAGDLDVGRERGGIVQRRIGAAELTELDQGLRLVGEREHQRLGQVGAAGELLRLERQLQAALRVGRSHLGLDQPGQRPCDRPIVAAGTGELQRVQRAFERDLRLAEEPAPGEVGQELHVRLDELVGARVPGQPVDARRQ